MTAGASEPSAGLFVSDIDGTLVTPDKPSAATWLKEHMLPDDAFVLDPQ